MTEIINKFKNPTYFNYFTFALFFLIIFSLISRFIFLDYRAIHHDESLHGYYSWLLSNGYGYTHNPLMHGPLNFHLNAFVFLILGDSDYTLRIAPAVAGIFVVLSPFLFIKIIGKYSSILISMFLLISPIVTYFSRFARNDIFVALVSLILIFQVFRYLNEVDGKKNLLIISICLGFIFCIKEISFIIIFILGSFSLIFSSFNPFIKNKLKLNYQFTNIFTLIFLLSFPLSMPISSYVFNFFGINLVAPSGSLTKIGMPIGNGAIITSFIISVISLLTSFVFGFLKFKKDWLLFFFIFWFIFIFFHSTFFTNPAGIITGFWQSLGYWISQQDVARGGQPWYYYFLLIIKYEYIGFLSFFIFIFYRKFKYTIFEFFLVYWSVLNIIIYVITSEKMPWLLVNIILPFIFISGILINELLSKIFRSNLMLIFKINILIIPFFFLILFIFNSVETNYVDSDKPDEMIVYTQTSKYVHLLSKEIINEINQNNANIIIDSSEGFTWPWAWYMRNHSINYFDSTKEETYKDIKFENYDYILVNTYNFPKLLNSRENEIKYNSISQIPFRMWFPENYRFNSFKDFANYVREFENISYLFGHVFKKDFSQNMGNVGLTILK